MHSKTNRWWGASILFLSLLVIVFACNASVAGASDAASVKELKSRVELDRQLLEKDLKALDVRIDVVDRRIDAQNEHVSHGLDLLGHMLTVLTIVLTVGGVAGYLTVSGKAKAEARSVAKGEVENWFAEHAESARNAIDELRVQLQAMQENASIIYAHHRDRMSDIDAATKALQEEINSRGRTGERVMSAEASLALAQSAKIAKDKPASERSADDWNGRAFDAYRNKDWLVAKESWEALSMLPGIGSVDKAEAMLNLAHVQAILGDNEGALNSYRGVVSKFSHSSEPELICLVVRALSSAAEILSKSGKKDEAIGFYDEAIARGQRESDVDVLDATATAMFNKGCVLGDLGDWSGAVSSYLQAIDKISSSADTDHRILAMSLVNLGGAQAKLGNMVLAIQAYDRVVDSMGDSSDEDIRIQVAKSLMAKGRALISTGKKDEGISMFDTLKSFAFNSRNPVRCYGAAALRYAADELFQMDRVDDALAKYQEMFSDFSVGESAEVDSEIAIAKFNKGAALQRLGRYDEELACYLECEKIIDRSALDGMDHFLMGAIVNEALTLHRLGKADEVVSAFDRLILRFEGDARPEFRLAVAKAEMARGFSLIDQGNVELGMLGLSKVVEKYYGDQGAEIEQAVLSSLNRMGDVAVGLSNYDEADSYYAKAIYRLGNIDKDSSDESVNEILLGVRIGRAFGLVSRAKYVWNQREESNRYLVDALGKFQGLNKDYPRNSLVLENISYCKHLLGAPYEEVAALLNESVRLGGVGMLDAAMSDAQIHPVPELDDQFISLVDSLRS